MKTVLSVNKSLQIFLHYRVVSFCFVDIYHDRFKHLVPGGSEVLTTFRQSTHRLGSNVIVGQPLVQFRGTASLA